VVFVADALGTWLVEQLADAGRKKLTELVLGSEQERALRRAADTAVWATAEEVSPPGTGQADQVAMVISEVFRNPAPAARPAGPVMLLQGLQAAIAGQLAVLEDAELTETGESSADVLGIPGTVLADRLAGHLVREIIVRGSSGGPLKPLADQFNHELTRLQIGGMLTLLAGEVRDALAHPGTGVTVAGRPLGEATDPFAFEVHHPLHLEDAPAGLPPLPPYVPREHDQALGQVVRATAGGRSGIAVLVGGSSVGKTRACWEALALLRDQDPPWRLWHPIDPSRPDAALAGLAGIGPRTVVWLNEAQFYLDTEAGLGERVAARLRELLRDPARAPVLVLATLWPRYWDTLTSRPDGSEDRHTQARELLAGHDITVPDAFTPAQMGQLAQATDARITLAAQSAPDGAVIQFLAGAPELLARYRNAPPAAAALIDAAMDARRLGMGPGLPHAFLEAAAAGYLTDTEWDALGEDWLQQALAYAAASCKGVPGPLTRIRPRPASRAARGRGDQPGGPAPDGGGPLYRLADYLDQHGRAHRSDQVPPAEFWSAAAAHAAPGDQAALGAAARARGLYRHAAQLHKNAAESGDVLAALYLSASPAGLRADPRPAHWAAAHAPLDDPRAVAGLVNTLRRAGAHEQTTALLARDPAAHVTLDDPRAVAGLLDILREAGADDQTATLASRAAAHVTLDDPGTVDRLLNSLLRAGAHEQTTALLARDPTAHVTLDDPRAVAELLGTLQKAGAHKQATALASRAATHAPLDDPGAVAWLLGTLQKAGAHEQTTALLARDPAAHVTLDELGAVAWMLGTLRRAGADEQATALASRAAAHAPLDDPRAVAELLGTLQKAGAHEQATALASRAATHAPLDDPAAMAWLLDGLLRAGAHEQTTALLARDPTAHVTLDDPRAVAELLGTLQKAGAHKQATALASRAATHAPLDDPGAVAWLLDGLREAGADDQTATLASRAAAHVIHADLGAVAELLGTLRRAGAHEQAATLANQAAAHVTHAAPSTVAWLLGTLRAAGAHEQAATLVARLPALGLFELFIEQEGSADQFRFGSEADGTPAAPWGWEALDLSRIPIRPARMNSGMLRHSARTRAPGWPRRWLQRACRRIGPNRLACQGTQRRWFPSPGCRAG
jgi:hypothetical protein